MITCPNCGSATVENYCAHCGQRHQAIQPLRRFIRDVADDQFGVDAKLPRTVAALFFRPGLLTSEYMTGRIARYIPPFRLYLMASVLFFVLLSFLSRQSDWAEVAGRQLERTRPAVPTADTARVDGGFNIGLTLSGEPWVEQVRVTLPWRWLDQKLQANLRALGELPPNVALRRTWTAIIEQLPKVMFLLLPVFALLLKLIHVRRRHLYVEHFVFALHVHAFAFGIFLLALLYRADWFVLATFLVIALYLLLAMKRVYAQGYFKTALKWLTLGFAYIILLLFGAVLAAIAGVATTGTA